MKHHNIIDYGTPDGKIRWANESPGIYRGVPPHIYHASPLLSNSKLQKISQKCPAAFIHAEQGGFTPSEDMAKGQAFHTLLLEPEVYRRVYEVGGINPTTKASFGYDTPSWHKAEAEALARGKILIRSQWLEPVTGMARAVVEHPDLRPILAAGGERELSMIWVDAVTGEKLRGRFDFMSNLKLFLDFKKTQDAGFGFDYSAAGYGYLEQFAMYHDGWLALTGESNDGFLVPVEEDAPHCVGTVRFTASGDNNFEDTGVSLWLHCARNCYRAAIRRVQECRKTGVWPSYDDRSVSVPEWYKRRHSKEKQS